MLYDGVGVILNLSAGAVAGRHHGVGVGSYLNLKHSQVFSDQDYRGTLRPDVVLLRDGIPSPHAKFANSSSGVQRSRATSFFTPATR
jgi:hypothetical protein